MPEPVGAGALRPISTIAKRLSLCRSAFDEAPFKSARSFPLVPFSLNLITRFSSVSVRRCLQIGARTSNRGVMAQSETARAGLKEIFIAGVPRGSWPRRTFPARARVCSVEKRNEPPSFYIEIIISRIPVLVDSGCRIVTTEELSKYFIQNLVVEARVDSGCLRRCDLASRSISPASGFQFVDRRLGATARL